MSLIKKYFLLGSALLLCNVAFTQPPPPPPPAGNGPPCWPPPCIPVDNGIFFAVAAAVLFGAFMIIRKMKAVSKTQPAN